MFELYIKYLLEGIAVAVAAYFIPRKKVEVSEIIFIALSAAATFAVLDIFAPKVGDGARKGAGFGIGANTVGWPMGGAENFEASNEYDDSSEPEHFYQSALPAKPAMNKAEPTEKECIERIKNLKKKVEDSKDKVKKASGEKRDMLMKKIQELEMRIKKLEEKLEKMGSAKKADAKKEQFYGNGDASSDNSTVTSDISSAVGSSVSSAVSTVTAVTGSSDSKSAETKSTETKSKDSSDMMSMDSTGSAVVGFSQGITQYANY